MKKGVGSGKGEPYFRANNMFESSAWRDKNFQKLVFDGTHDNLSVNIESNTRHAGYKKVPTRIPTLLKKKSVEIFLGPRDAAVEVILDEEGHIVSREGFQLSVKGRIVSAGVKIILTKPKLYSEEDSEEALLNSDDSHVLRIQQSGCNQWVINPDSSISPANEEDMYIGASPDFGKSKDLGKLGFTTLRCFEWAKLGSKLP